MVSNKQKCSQNDNVGTYYDQNMVSNSRNCVRNDDFDTNYCAHDFCTCTTIAYEFTTGSTTIIKCHSSCITTNVNIACATTDNKPGSATTTNATITWNNTADDHSLHISLSSRLSSTSSLLPSSLNKFRSTAAIDVDVDPDTVIEFTIVHHGCALYLYVVPILY